jgi:hypothetical protein
MVMKVWLRSRWFLSEVPLFVRKAIRRRLVLIMVVSSALAGHVTLAQAALLGFDDIQNLDPVGTSAVCVAATLNGTRSLLFSLDLFEVSCFICDQAYAACTSQPGKGVGSVSCARQYLQCLNICRQTGG